LEGITQNDSRIIPFLEKGGEGERGGREREGKKKHTWAGTTRSQHKKNHNHSPSNLLPLHLRNSGPGRIRGPINNGGLLSGRVEGEASEGIGGGQELL
jgi:hypothetical protein